MALQRTRLRFYTAPTDVAELEWDFVAGQLRDAGTYWVCSRPGESAHPHPRPVWGVWLDDAVWLTVGSPRIRRELEADVDVTIHLDSGVDVVIVEGRAAPATGDLGPFLAAYDAKYDWKYDAEEYGSPTRVEVNDVIAWRSAGFAGRDGFQQAGRWVKA